MVLRMIPFKPRLGRPGSMFVNATQPASGVFADSLSPHRLPRLRLAAGAGREAGEVLAKSTLFSGLPPS
jgi:hypothetical protein